MPLVFAAATNHGPGITARRETAPEDEVAPFFEGFERLHQRIEAAKLDALVMVSSDHIQNLYMDNMPAFIIGLGDSFPGPTEDEHFLKIPKTIVPGAPDLAAALADEVMETVDLAYSGELALDHGFMVPLHFLTPDYDVPVVPLIINCMFPPYPKLGRAYELGRALRRAIDQQPGRIGLLGTGGLSHWPAAPLSGKVAVEWDREFLDAMTANRRDDMIRYTDAEIERDGGPGGHEIRSWITVAGACEGSTGVLDFYTPLPSFAIGGAVVEMTIA
ncbi:MAG: extradiol ring-cleavage dioxygenase [Alphaproteobacteria bacterium]|nr:extradiol ring-cleavage dioxygenase [Alphaproteobacteria bacterium]